MARQKSQEKSASKWNWDEIAPRLSTFTPSNVIWLWRHYLQIGSVTILEGDPGEGKSNFCAWLIASVTTGGESPDGQSIDQGFCLVIDVEDDPSKAIYPRIQAAGGDVELVRLIHWFQDPSTRKRRCFQLPEDLEMLEDHLRENPTSLVVIDTLMNHLSPSISARDDQKVRTALAPLGDLAQRYGVCILLLRHLNKGDSKNAKYKGAGSVGIGGAARQVLLIGPDPDRPEMKVLAGVKENNGPKPASLQFEITGREEGPSWIVWRGSSARSANELVREKDPAKVVTQEDRAEEELEILLSSGPKKMRTVEAELAAMKISSATIRRAKLALGVVSERIGNGPDAYWTWRLPTDEDKNEKRTKNRSSDESIQRGDMGNVRTSDSDDDNSNDKEVSGEGVFPSHDPSSASGGGDIFQSNAGSD